MECIDEVEAAKRSLKLELDRRWSRYTKHWNPRGTLPAVAVAAIEPLAIALARLGGVAALLRSTEGR